VVSERVDGRVEFASASGCQLASHHGQGVFRGKARDPEVSRSLHRTASDAQVRESGGAGSS